MKRALAGIYDPASSGNAERRRAMLAKALAGDGEAQTVADGPLALAWTGSPSPGVRDPDRPFALVDGSLYNVDALAKEACLPPDRGTSEQVVVAAYERWGEGIFERLRGDFVVLIWDPRVRRLLVARDQVNARGLYTHAAGSRLLFASEVRNLLRMLSPRPNPASAPVAHWLLHSRVPPDRTLYEGIRRVEAGHFLRATDGRWDSRRYWSPSLGPPLQGSHGELADELKAQITAAVRRRCREDDTTAIMLSGGLDSSTLAAVATRALEPVRAPVAAYSATFPQHPESDESALIDIVAPTLGLPSTRIAVSGGGVLAGSLEYLSSWELPASAFTLYFWLPLARRAAEDGVSVILDGENGDDLFGYSPWLVADFVRRGRPLEALRLLRRTPEASEANWQRLLREMYILGVKGNVPQVAHRAIRRARRPKDYAPSWFNASTASAYFDTMDFWAWKLADAPRWWSNRIATLITDAFPAALYDHARRRAAMAGLERRHPFADLDLIQFVHRLPPELHFDARLNRPLLRQSMAGLVPDEVRLRATKTNLNQMFHTALAADLPAVRRLLLGKDAELRAYVRPEALPELLGPPPQGSEHELNQWGFRIWRLAEVECWLRSQERPSFPEEFSDREALAKVSCEFVQAPAAKR